MSKGIDPYEVIEVKLTRMEIAHLRELTLRELTTVSQVQVSEKYRTEPDAPARMRSHQMMSSAALHNILTNATTPGWRRPTP